MGCASGAVPAVPPERVVPAALTSCVSSEPPPKGPRAPAGLLRQRTQPLSRALITSVKDAALTRLSPRLRERLFRGAGALLPGLLESQVRFGAIDMRRTRVWSDELNYFPALCFNIKGREPQGIVEAAQLPALQREVEAALYALRDPQTGQQVVKRVYTRAQLFHGPELRRAPDLLLGLALSDGYSYNLMPSSTAPPGTGAFRRLAPSEYLGRKGRSLAGSHRDRGLFIAAGPSIRPVGEIDAAIGDVSATFLARMQLQLGAAHSALDGRVLDELLVHPRGARTLAVPFTTAHEPASVPPDRNGRVEARLRRLGYID